MAADMFLKIEGIDGESQDTTHAGEIEILSWSWGENNSGSMSAEGGGGTARVNMQDLSLSFRANKASPKLMLACATGQHIPEAKLTCRKAGGDQIEYYKVTLRELLVSSYQTGGSGDDIPIESCSLNFAEIEYEYCPQGADGAAADPVTVKYNLKQRAK